MLFLRLLGRGRRRFRLGRPFRRFHLKNKLRGHIVMQLDRDFVFARRLDRMIQYDLMSIYLGAELVLEPVHDVLRRDRTKSFAGFAGFKSKDDARFADPAS